MALKVAGAISGHTSMPGPQAQNLSSIIIMVNRRMVYYRAGSARSDYELFFDVELRGPLCVLTQEMRSEAEYDAEETPEQTALDYIKQVGRCFGGEIYLVTASHDVRRSSKLRLKKTALWGHEELRKLDTRSFEVQMRGGGTRLISIVDMKNYSYGSSANVVLNWAFSHIVFTNVDIDTLGKYERRWLAKDDKSVLAFDYSDAAKDLGRLPSTSVLRYFPADNGRSETIAALGRSDFVEKSIRKCIAAIE